MMSVRNATCAHTEGHLVCWTADVSYAHRAVMSYILSVDGAPGAC